jgi:serine phosphatase RsbU (regulator of sigma subunit)
MLTSREFDKSTRRRPDALAIAPTISASVTKRSATNPQLRGGDVFELVACRDGVSAFLFADISSKAALSAVHVGMLQRAFASATATHRGPGAILSELNRMRFDDVPGATGVTFSTAFVGIVDRQATRLTFASAGHDLALVLRGRAHEHLAPTGPLLGVIQNACYLESNTPFISGDRLVLASDGVTECRNMVDSSLAFGSSGVIRALHFDQSRSCRSASNIVLRGADNFCGGAYRDDATVVVICRKRNLLW